MGSFSKKPTPEIREQIIIEYAPLVKVVAGRLSMYLGNNVEFDDLVSYGVFGRSMRSTSSILARM